MPLESTIANLPSNRFTPMELKVLNFIKEHQPCTFKSIVECGVKEKTASNILGRIKFIKRATDPNLPGRSSRLWYWLDAECAPVIDNSKREIERAQSVKAQDTITQDPIIASLFGMKVTQCRAHF